MLRTRYGIWLVASAVLGCLGILGLLGPPSTLAQECTVEVEPNDAPETALAMRAPGCLTGGLDDEEDIVDHVIWTLDAEQAGQRWSVTLTSTDGQPVTLALSRIISDPAAPTISTEPPLVELRADTGPGGPAASADLLLRPGRYVLAISPGAPWTGTPTAYRVDVGPGAPMPVSADQEPNDDPTQASAVQGAFEVSGDAAGTDDFFAWQVDDAAAPGLWTLDVQAAVGVALALTLTDEGGSVLGDARSGPNGSARLPDLRLRPGLHTIRLAGIPAASAPYILRADQEGVPHADAEPNDDAAHALPIIPDRLMAGRLARPGDVDAYRLSVDAALGAVLLDARLIVQSGPPRRLCLARLEAGAVEGTEVPRELTCADGQGGASVTGLLLEPGDYLLVVSGEASQLDPYYLRVDRAGTPQAGYEVEPNDTPALATSMLPDTTMRGRLGNPDFFRLRVDGEPQLWEAEARGPEVRLSWARTDGAAVGLGVDPDGARERSVLTDVYLIPGDHWFRLDGEGEYELTFSPLGPPIPGGEREPNDGLAFANTLPMDGSVTGRIGTAADIDSFRFSLAATEHVLLTLEPPPDATLTMWPEGDTATLASYRVARAGEPVELDLVLPAGDHAVRVTGQPTSDRYRLSLSRLDPFRLAVDQEPNDEPSMAGPMPATLRAEGTVHEGDPGDWYRLPTLLAAGELTIKAQGVIRSLVINDGTIQTTLVAEGDGSTFRSPPLLAGASVALGVVADGPYQIAIDTGSTGLDQIADDEGLALPVELTLTTAVSEVAAFEVPGQRVEAVLALTNTGSDPVGLTLDAATSHPAWTVGFESPDVALGPRETAEVPVSIVVPAQAGADSPVRATVRARAGLGQATAFAEVTPRSDAALVGPFRWWSLPDELLGGLDAAANGLGAVPLVSVDPVAEAALHDGTVPLDGGMDIATTLPLTLGVDLAGDEPVPVSGTILDPTAGPAEVAGTVRGFDLLLSADGVTYETVLSGELSGALTEQAFVLPEPVLARFAQLRITSRFPGSDRLRLGEWKVVASPGWRPTPEPLDLADPSLGGHVVWIDPQPGGPLQLDTMLSDPAGLADLLGFDRQEVSRVSWVLGFLNGRAARVAELQWLDPPGSRPELRLETVELSGSLDGPLGPWTPLGTWELERDAAGTVAPFQLDAPTWLSHIRMGARIPERSGDVLELPGALRVLEDGPSDDYRSIIGEWGHASSAGPLEWQEPVESAGLGAATDTEGPSLDGADVALVAGQPFGGRVTRGVDEDWYAFDVPEGQASVRFTVSGRPTVGVGLALFDERGLEVPLAVTPGERPGTVDHAGTVTAGARYRLLVDQPPFSVVVVFDTSGSVGGYVPSMTGALRSYLNGLVPGEEAVQLLDLEGTPMPDEFSDDRWLILSALDAHAGSHTGSSQAEIGLIDALDLLAGREGERAILLMTDADSGAFDHHSELWRRLALIRPRIFTVHVAGTLDPLLHRRLMQDWAAAGAGYYEHVRSSGSIEQAFDRMAAWLRRPADYGLVMGLSTEPAEPPEPGSLRVVSDPNAPAQPDPADTAGIGTGRQPDVAVELVLDTSGSMLRKLGRKRRIDVAKDVLTRLVAERLAPGTPVALRVFRQVARSCESELAAPLGPLDRASMAATIDTLGVKRTVSTPLAAAIEAVATDLAGVTGPRVVVVLTDGEESCGGDPEAAVQALVDQGFDLTFNVVGLGLDRKVRPGIARLAEIGGGAYYDARNAAGLAEALSGALGAPYVVLDVTGQELGRSTVDGPPVELLPGTYRVALAGSSESLDVVVVESGEQRTLVARG